MRKESPSVLILHELNENGIDGDADQNVMSKSRRRLANRVHHFEDLVRCLAADGVHREFDPVAPVHTENGVPFNEITEFANGRKPVWVRVFLPVAAHEMYVEFEGNERNI